MIERQIDRPIPKPPGFGRVEGLEQPVNAFWRQPRTRISSKSVLAVLITNSRNPSLVPLMASAALTIKLRITCCSCTRSP